MSLSVEYHKAMDHRHHPDGHAHQAYDGEARHPFCQQEKECEVEVVENIDDGNKMPFHRQWCINKGCPYVCCIPKARIFWIILLLLIQIGAIAILLLDLKFNETYGSTLSRYQSQQGLITSSCTIEKYEITDFESCPCTADNPHCEGLGRNYGCMTIFVKAHDAYTKEIVTNDAQLYRSDWEYALVKKKNKCFNLDICGIDMDRSWENYKRKIYYYMELFDQYRQDIGTFTCYVDYPESYKITPSALMELNTRFSDLFVWFIMPILTVGVCWIGIVFSCYWYGCPCAKKKKRKYEHHKIYREGGTATDYDDSDMSPSQSGTGGLGHSGSNDSGGWPKSGPADHDTGGSWPMYWR